MCKCFCYFCFTANFNNCACFVIFIWRYTSAISTYWDLCCCTNKIVTCYVTTKCCFNTTSNSTSCELNVPSVNVPPCTVPVNVAEAPATLPLNVTAFACPVNTALTPLNVGLGQYQILYLHYQCLHYCLLQVYHCQMFCLDIVAVPVVVITASPLTSTTTFPVAGFLSLRRPKLFTYTLPSSTTTLEINAWVNDATLEPKLSTFSPLIPPPFANVTFVTYKLSIGTSLSPISKTTLVLPPDFAFLIYCAVPLGLPNSIVLTCSSVNLFHTLT